MKIDDASTKTPEFERRLNVEFWNSCIPTVLKLELADSRVIQEAKELRRNGQYRECLALLEGDEATFHDPEGLMVAGLALWGLEQFDKAIKAFETSEALLQKRQAVALTNKSGCLLLQGKHKEAEASLRKSLELDPHYVSTWVNLFYSRFPEPETIPDIASELKELWPSWNKSQKLKHYFVEDPTMKPLRDHPQFIQLFSELLEANDA